MKNLNLLFLFFISISFAQISDFADVDYTKADNIAKLHHGEQLTNIPKLTNNLTKDLPNNTEKFRAIYTWICTNIKGDAQQSNKIDRKRKKLKNNITDYLNWNNLYKKTAFKKLLKKKKTGCSGYTRLLKEMCFLANIPCKIIDGYGRTATANVTSLETPNHSWNAVKLNNKWYLCDPTWSAGYIIDGVFVQDYNTGYFLTDPVLFSKNHYPLDKKWLLTGDTSQRNYVIPPLVYGDTFIYKIIPVFPKKMEFSVKKNTAILFRFKLLIKIPIKKVSLITYKGESEKTLKIENINYNNGFMEFKHHFKNKGTFDIHLKINTDIVATYTVSVYK